MSSLRATLLVLLLATPRLLSAAEESLLPEGMLSPEAPAEQVIQNRKYDLQHEIVLLGGGLPADPYYKGVTATVGYTYHLGPNWAWSVARFTYSFNFDSQLKEEVIRIAGNTDERPFFPEVDWMVASHLVLKPLYGKEALFNTDVVHLEAFLLAGPALLYTTGIPRPRRADGERPPGTKESLDFGIDLGAGLRLWLARGVSFRVDIGEVVYLARYDADKGTQFKQALHLHAGFAFNLRGDE